MKEIGGYFELELAKNQEYHRKLVKLNSGRNAFKYILEAQKPHKVYIPVYICDSIIEPLVELDIKYQFYNIDKNFEIAQDIEVKNYEKLLYVNYFSLKSNYVNRLAEKYGDKLIIDNTQAFFEKPLLKIDTIYSPRKFFGVSDGGYLNTDKFTYTELLTDKSYNYAIHLLGRCDKDASTFYKDFQIAEQRLNNQPIKKMSNLTQKILSSIDYEEVQKKRKENFSYLHEALKDKNQLDINMLSETIPFVYPFIYEGGVMKS